MRVFVRPNTSSWEARVVEDPWNLPPLTIPEGLDKTGIRKLWSDPSLEHAFLTGFEGMTETAFISTSQKNRPVRMWCLIVDYDALLTPDTRANLVTFGPCEYAPAWLAKSVSGKGRLVWEFEAPVGIANDVQAKALMKQFERRLVLNTWLPGLDTKCLHDIYQCYELGYEWVKVSDKKIPTAALDRWLLEASKNIDLVSAEDEKVDIPLDLVAAEVQKLWPGRWEGAFELGARGVRFWDPIADNPTAAVVCPDGMLCFTGPHPFMSWQRVFQTKGSRFVDKYLEAKAHNIVDRVLWDDRQFWFKEDDSMWERYNTVDFSRKLKCKGFNSKPEGAGKASEIDRVITTIQSTQRIRAALPFIFQAHGPMEYQNERVLNTSRIQVLRPAEPGVFTSFEQGATKFFPFIWGFLSNFLELVDGRAEQLNYLLHWMKVTYETSLNLKPHRGQALVFAGPTSTGKTFFTYIILNRMLGGMGDGSSYMIKGSQWSSSLVKWPLAVIDDQDIGVDAATHASFSAIVKKLVANAAFSYNGKYESTGQVEWYGRVVIICNNDPESMRILPTMDINNADKISLLLVSDASRFTFKKGMTEEMLSRIVDEELPYFCRYLLDMKIDQGLRERRASRFYLEAYHHPALLRKANRGSTSYSVFELLTSYLRDYAIQKPDARYWEGTATDLFKNLAQYNVDSKTVMGHLTPRSLGSALDQLKARGVPLDFQEQSTGVRQWKIPVTLSWRDDNVVRLGESASELLKMLAGTNQGDGSGQPGDSSGQPGDSSGQSGNSSGQPEPGTGGAPETQSPAQGGGADGGTVEK